MFGWKLKIVWSLSLVVTLSVTAIAADLPDVLKSHATKRTKITRIPSRGAFYYLVSSRYPDGYETLYDANGTWLCAPSGGISGRGYGKCPDPVRDLEWDKGVVVWNGNFERPKQPGGQQDMKLQAGPKDPAPLPELKIESRLPPQKPVGKEQQSQ